MSDLLFLTPSSLVQDITDRLTSEWPEGSQSRRTTKYGHESRGILNQESLCCRGSAAIYPTRLTDRIHNEPSPLKISHTNLNWTNHINYLRVILDSKITDSPYISGPLCKANHKFRQLYRILNKSSCININRALTSYTVTCIRD
jgi:hypothetical protein